MVDIKRNELLIGKRPTELLSIGPSFEDNPSDIVLVIPGNPGVASYYTSFMRAVYSGLKGSQAVWTISHAGHCSTSHMSPQLGKDVYNLKEQLDHKINFIRDYIPKGARVTLIGHSIGCQIILNVLQALEENTDIEIRKSYLLFPTIERMKDSPNGTRLWPVLKYFRWLTVFLTILISFLPRKIKEWVIYLHLGRKAPEHAIAASVELLNPKIVQNMMWMAYNELNEVCEPNLKALEKHKDKIMFYYGKNDGWCPLDYHRDLVALLPEINAQVCQEGFAHAFVLHDSEGVGEKITEWMTS